MNGKRHHFRYFPLKKHSQWQSVLGNINIKTWTAGQALPSFKDHIIVISALMGMLMLGSHHFLLPQWIKKNKKRTFKIKILMLHLFQAHTLNCQTVIWCFTEIILIQNVALLPQTDQTVLWLAALKCPPAVWFSCQTEKPMIKLTESQLGKKLPRVFFLYMGDTLFNLPVFEGVDTKLEADIKSRQGFATDTPEAAASPG